MISKELRRNIYEELQRVMDPELVTSIVDLDLVDDVDINDDTINVSMHLTSPYCPPVFGFKIAHDVCNNLKKIEGINNVRMNITGHFMAEAINNAANSL